MAKQRQKLIDRVTDWTTQFAQRQSRLSWLGCVGAAVGAVPVLFVTFWAIYAGVYVGFSGLISGHAARLFVSGVVLILIFVGYATANWEHLQSLRFESSDRLQMARLAAYATGQSGISLLAGPQTMHSVVKVIAVTLLLGPGLVDVALRLAGRAKLLRGLNAAAVAQALVALLEAEKRVSVEELATAASIDAERLMLNFSLIDGIVLLQAGEPAFTLTDELRQELLDHRVPQVAE